MSFPSTSLPARLASMLTATDFFSIETSTKIDQLVISESPGTIVLMESVH
jgi:hypothetical protein